MLDTLTLFRRFYPSGLRTVYVSATGSDSASGLTSGAAKKTIKAAADIAQPGDRISVAAGVYGYVDLYGINGTAKRWITIEAQPGAIVDVSNQSTNGIDRQQCSYLAIYGFEVRASQTQNATDPSGICVFRGCHHVATWACDVHDFPGGGINHFYTGVYNDPQGRFTLPAGGWDAVDVFFNHIHATSKYSVYNTSGVSFYGGEDLTNGSTIDGRYGYRAVGNYIHDVICTVPYTPGGFNVVTDGNGISPDSLAVPNNLYPNLAPYLKRGLVEGNLITACGGRGVHIYNAKNVECLNNTCIGNLRSAPTSGAIRGSTEIDLQLDTPDANNGVVIAGNVFAPMNTSKTIDLSAQTVTGNVVLGGTDTVTSGNLDRRSTGLAWFQTQPGMADLIAGVAVADLAPVAKLAATKRIGALGYQVTGAGGRDPRGQSAGALEPLTTALAFR